MPLLYILYILERSTNVTTNIVFNITAGLPFAKTIVVTLTNGRTWWTVRDDFEVLFQIRDGQNESDTLLLDLVQYLTITFDDLDTVTIALVMSGAETRNLTESGYYDVVMSDTGVDDDRGFKVLKGRVNRKTLVSAAEESIL